MSRVRSQGFTLLEMIIALAIFAMLSLSAYQVLQSVLLNDEITKRRAQRLSEIQRAFNSLERDFSSAIIRTVKTDSDGDDAFVAQPYQLQSDDGTAVFVRNGWINPGSLLPRSELERIAYRLKEGQLQRMSYRYPDPPAGSEPLVSTLLTGVSEFKLRFYLDEQWVDRWESVQDLPEGVEITLELDGYGRIQRLFMLTVGGRHQ